MILKAMNYDTGRWVLYEAEKIELGKAWIGFFGPRGDPGTQLALFDREREPQENPDGDPVARRAPILLGLNAEKTERWSDLLLDCHSLHEVFATNGETRAQVNMALVHRANGDERLVVFGQAYLMNDAGKTVEKL